jgi:hypothetical protein
MFDKLEYNRAYSKLYYLRQKDKMKPKGSDTENNIDIDYMDLIKKKPMGNLALQRKRLARELKKNEERVLAYKNTLEKEREILISTGTTLEIRKTTADLLMLLWKIRNEKNMILNSKLLRIYNKIRGIIFSFGKIFF